MLAWRRVLNESPCKHLTPFKDNGQNSGTVRNEGSDYTMDEVAAYNSEFDDESSQIMQGARVTGDYETRTHLMMAIKLVYQLQSDEENWTRWADLTHHYHEVQAKSFYNISERMEENLDRIPPVGFSIYRTFTMIDFCKFEQFYSRNKWDNLLVKLNNIHSYYLENKDVISKLKLEKGFVFPVRTPSHFE